MVNVSQGGCTLVTVSQGGFTLVTVSQGGCTAVHVSQGGYKVIHKGYFLKNGGILGQSQNHCKFNASTVASICLGQMAEQFSLSVSWQHSGASVLIT